MIILNAVYKKPIDKTAFQKHYNDIHLPLAAKTPGLIKSEIEFVSSVFIGEAEDYYMIARLYFENKETFKAAMKSEENQAAGKDLMNFAQGRVSLYVTENTVT